MSPFVCMRVVCTYIYYALWCVCVCLLVCCCHLYMCGSVGPHVRRFVFVRVFLRGRHGFVRACSVHVAWLYACLHACVCMCVCACQLIGLFACLLVFSHFQYVWDVYSWMFDCLTWFVFCACAFSEEIAFYQGNRRENKTIHDTFNRLVSVNKDVSFMNFCCAADEKNCRK